VKVRRGEERRGEEILSGGDRAAEDALDAARRGPQRQVVLSAATAGLSKWAILGSNQ